MTDFKAALRSLLSTPGPTLVVIATLAVAIGANTAIFSVVNGVLLRPIGYENEDALVVLWGTQEANPEATFRLSPADYRDTRDMAQAFDGQVLLYRSIGSTLTGLEPAARVGSLAVTSRLFQVLGATPALGQFFTDEDEVPGGGRKVVLTHASWTRRFGADPEIVGSSIELDGAPAEVVGVAREGFRFPPGSDDVEVYFPMGLSDGILLDRNHRMFDSVARLRDGVTLEAARAELTAIADRLAQEFPDSNAGWKLTAEPLRREMVGDLSATLWVLAGAVFLVLLIACANIANILVARSTAAGREFAVRAALGARRSELARRSLVESLILGLLGAAGGLLLAFLGVKLLSGLLPPDLQRGADVTLDARVLLVAALLSVGATVLFGSVPALRSMAPDLLDLLKPGGAFGSALGGGRRLRESMVVIEVALAIVLLIGGGLMVRSFFRLNATDPGFRQESVLSVAVQLPNTRYERTQFLPFFERLLESVRALPGTRVAGAVSDLPMSDIGLDFELEFQVPGLESLAPTARPNAEVRLVVPGYFEAMGIELVDGRFFDPLDASSERTVAIVNQTVVDRYFQNVDPIGRSLDLDMLGEVDIVGVVSDIRHHGLMSKYESELFIPYGKMATSEMHIVVWSDQDTAEVASGIRGLLSEMDPDLAPSSVVAISDLLWESVAQPRFLTALLAGLALCAALLAAVGTYGIVAYTVSVRAGEIGVRMALGADSADTVSMVVRQAVSVVLTGAALGTLGALLATRFLDRLLFEVPTTDPWTYGGVWLATVGIGLLAAWIPARRATRIDPVSALREG